ncbi:hypothetical protein CA51_48180 [Rosistilla oblonga]|nr:hypothetical protein CA51_48180 [Rosistilla oblonga]
MRRRTRGNNSTVKADDLPPPAKRAFRILTTDWAATMNSQQTASQVLDRHYLEARARILEIAAIFDRIDRAQGSTGEDPRDALLRQGIEILSDSAANRAEQVQKLFSREYNADWRDEMGV